MQTSMDLPSQPVVDNSAEARIDALEQSVDAFFVLIAGFLVFFMQCGFMLLSAGALRSKNVGNIILQTLLDACFGCLGWFLVGHAIANGASSGSFVGTDEFALHSVETIDKPTWFFQYAFAASTVTIVTGAVAERTRFVAYLLYAFFLTAWVYPAVAHWVWNEDGWLAAIGEEPNFYGSGMLDFAGCSVVHMVGGLAGLAGAVVLGPRIGRFDYHGRPNDLPGHSATTTLMGVFVLWFGWYGFNPGSVLGLTDGKIYTVITCTVTTTLSAVSSCLSSLAILSSIKYLTSGQVVFDVIGAGNGALAGLVGITAACAFVQSWAAIVIGIVSAFVFVSSSFFISHILKVDDPLDAVAMHAFCGAWGLVAAGLFADRDLLHKAGYHFDDHTYGLLLGGNTKLLLAALLGILVVSLWVLGQMFPFFYVIKKLGYLRVTPDQEQEGLDMTFHGVSAFPKDPTEKTKAEEVPFILPSTAESSYISP